MAESAGEREDERIMKIAVTNENGNVFPHFWHTEQFKVYDIEDGKVAGNLAFDPDVHCSHHGEGHHHGNGHHCGEDKHGCAGNGGGCR